MKLKQILTTVALGGLTAVFAVGFAACSSPKAQTSDTAESMPGMNHSAGPMNMDLGPKDESLDLRFIDGMIPHHQGGVEMAQEALQKSQRPEIKQLATAIITAQEKEISQLQDWRKAWYPNVAETPMMYDASMGHMMPMSAEVRDTMMMSGDLGAADDQFDLRFLNAMIPHHEGALDMANQVLKNSDRPEIRQMAQDILTSQQAEIDQMQQWRKDWYGQ
ncbi:MAG: DUF305 domain-containing protein [Pegethrix bostrychoides GSE-TBD4-15B]|uniref:DUF305 domain-containing protein n=1 Tax=Pegethrix bostrychoides GSE-TBD4-15B TaxID=2839662 RepID=A0A951U502_9CYAN|nr:DUF305 domain-containing protein [Pegethrix bostrychoides GSE-TBD4-15B]